MRKWGPVLVGIVGWLGVARAEPTSPRDALVVSVEWLSAHLDDPNLVLLQVGNKEEYAQKHLPRARHVVLADISVSARPPEQGLMLEMPRADELRRRLEAIGISDNSRIVVAFSRDWISPATRVMFTLDYAGLGWRSALLDGGLEAWERSGRAVTDVTPEAKSGSLAPLKIRRLVVGADEVRSALGKEGRVVIDGRASSFYDGVETGGGKGFEHRTGHITGARSIPFTSVVDDRSMLRRTGELAALFEQAGVKRGDTVIGYCHVGQQATAMLFAARLLGHSVLLYDGSFEDWSRRNYPVENPSTRAAK